MLSIQNLTIRYGDLQAVTDLSLDVASGEIVTVVGPTGCGKSSVLRAIGGLIPPHQGEIYIDGTSTSQPRFLPPEKRNTGIVFQDFALFPHLNVERNIGFRVKNPKLVDHWINALGLNAFRSAMPETLSGGQKQRVALARSLAHEPRLLLLDEPLSNLDAALKIELRIEIRQAIKQAGVTAVWVTHDQDEAMAVGDRIAVMRDSHLEQLDTPEICFEAPRSRFVARFFGNGRFLKGTVEQASAQTAVGTHSVVLHPHVFESPYRADSSKDVELLYRPHDIGIASEGAANCTVTAQLYEGETRRYILALDSGETIEARLPHEVHHDQGSRVHAYIKANHPLAAYPVEAV